MALKTAFFEREYDKTLGKTAQLIDEERRRLLHVDQLLLQFDNENLQLQLKQFKQDLARARDAELDIRNLLQDTIQERDQLQSSAHTATHEIESLRVRQRPPFSRIAFTDQESYSANWHR